jgi:hypothetical protein
MFWVGDGTHEAHVRERVIAALGLVAWIIATGVFVAVSILVALGAVIRAFS